MRLPLTIALRFLTASKGQTLLIAIGIAIGIAVQIFIGSLIQGLQISLLDATIGRSSHITIANEDKNENIEINDSLNTWINEKIPTIKARATNVTKGALIDLPDSDTNVQAVLRGFDFDEATPLYRFDSALTEGVLPTLQGQVAIGLALAEENGISLGDEISVIIPDRIQGPSVESATETLKVVGLLDFKVAALNQSWMLGRIEDVRAYYEMSDDQATSVEIQIEEPFDADLYTADLIASRPTSTLKAVDWKSLNEQLLSGLSGQSTSSYMIQVFVVISVVLGIASVLAISVLQKSRQLGILKAMGITDGAASRIFLWQGAILGVIGGLIGILIGFGLLWSFSTFALKPDGTPVVPIYINWSFIALSGGIAVVASTLASLMPAAKSKRLSVIEVIKNG